MKKLFSAIAVLFVLFTAPFSADANRTIFKNRTIPPHFLESAPIASDIQTFLATGTWYRKPGVEYVLVILAAGGGEGGDSGGVNAGGGGQGGECKTEIVDVRGTTSETVTIGAGGAGGAGNGNNGGASSFGALVTCLGGKGGLQNGAVGTQLTAQTPKIGSGIGGADGYAGWDGAYGEGGATLGGTEGGGGGGSYGAGADGNAGATGDSAAANTGGGGAGASQAAGNGGSGGTGILIVISLPRSITLP